MLSLNICKDIIIILKTIIFFFLNNNNKIKKLKNKKIK